MKGQRDQFLSIPVSWKRKELLAAASLSHASVAPCFGVQAAGAVRVSSRRVWGSRWVTYCPVARQRHCLLDARLIRNTRTKVPLSIVSNETLQAITEQSCLEQHSSPNSTFHLTVFRPRLMPNVSTNATENNSKQLIKILTTPLRLLNRARCQAEQDSKREAMCKAKWGIFLASWCSEHKPDPIPAHEI